jgi:GH24 family phage-related lysozyme (muramidase)
MPLSRSGDHGSFTRSIAAIVELALCATLAASCATIGDAPMPGVWLEPPTRGGALPPGMEWRSMGPRGLELTKVSEAFRAKVYNDPVGFCTVGYGHLIKRVRCDGTEPPEFLPSISKGAATRLLQEDLRIAEYPVLTEVSGDIELTETQFDALVDFVFNVGSNNFRQSTLLKVINAGEFHHVPAQLRRWVNANGKKLRGLVTRREREIELFMEGVGLPRGEVTVDEDLPAIDIRSGEQ